MTFTLRPARHSDEAALAALDRRSWSVDSEVAPPPREGAPFFDGQSRPEDYVVAEIDGAVVGWVKSVAPLPLPSNAHVRQIQGLQVESDFRGRGTGRALLDDAVRRAGEDGCRRVTLRVLATNVVARRLYERAGFVVEGVLRGEFHLGGRDVDDIQMARSLL